MLNKWVEQGRKKYLMTLPTYSTLLESLMRRNGVSFGLKQNNLFLVLFYSEYVIHIT